jgi:hypothetical protein
MVDPLQDIVIQDSTVPGAGLGLFAKTNLEKGTVLGTYPGAVLPLQQNLDKLAKYPPCEGYIWRFSDNKMVIDPTNAVGVLDPVCFGGNPSMPGSLWLFKNVLGKFVNADTALCRINEPPRGGDRNVVIDENLDDRAVIFSLERDVSAEEFFDYGQRMIEMTAEHPTAATTIVRATRATLTPTLSTRMPTRGTNAKMRRELLNLRYT